MGGNTFGQIFRVTTFGESHGEALGCVIDGCPAGIVFDNNFLQNEMRRRRPSSAASSTKRQENDEAEVLSGVFEGTTEGTPIAILIRNTNQHSKDYDAIRDKLRPGHADYTYLCKYGARDWRGGGRSSGRETCARVAAGAVAKMLLAASGISVTAYTKEAAGIAGTSVNFSEIERNPMRAADREAARLMMQKVEEYRASRNSCGGIVECVVRGAPAGLGEPVFDKLDATISHAVMSIGAIKGIEFGKGFEAARLSGRDNNDEMRRDPTFTTNNAGGILGGISRGDDIVFRAAVKPVPSISLPQKTIDTSGAECDIVIEGRHDVCLCPRIVPVIEAMSAITIADALLLNRAARI